VTGPALACVPCRREAGTSGAFLAYPIPTVIFVVDGESRCERHIEGTPEPVVLRQGGGEVVFLDGPGPDLTPWQELVGKEVHVDTLDVDTDGEYLVRSVELVGGNIEITLVRP
jgi:hypothetical protein